MKRKVLACLTMLVLASLLAVSAFAATGGVSSLVLGEAADGVDYTAMKTGQTFDVYLVVSPLEQAGSTTNYIYRPNESTKGGKPITNAQSDIWENVYTVTWDDTLVELVTDGVSLVSGVEATASAAGTDKGGNTLYYGFMAQKNANTQLAAEVVTESDKVTITYDNDTKFAGVVVKGRGAVANAVVAKLTFRVLATTEGGDPAIRSTDTYKIGSADASATSYNGQNGSVSVTVAAAGCLHTDTEFVSTKTPATCYSDGVDYHKCLNPECGETIEVVNTDRPAHSFDDLRYFNGEEADCTTGGRSALFCSNEGCTNYDETSVETVDALGHDWVNVPVEPKTCSFDGVSFYYCSRCAHTLSPESDPDDADPEFAAPYYNVADGKFYTGSSFYGSAIDGSVCYHYDRATGHNWSKNASGTYTCSNANCDFADEAPVSGGSVARYATTDGSGDGTTADTATSFQKAFDLLASLPEDVTGYLYIVDGVDLAARRVSDVNTDAKSFEEKEHGNSIVITTDPDADSNATLKFVEKCTRYFLYGPTTFENITFASYAADTTVNKEAPNAPKIAARGFKLVLGEGIKMAGTEYALTKNGVTFDMSAIKLYIVGGCIDNGLYEGFNPYTFNTEMEIYSGKYFNVTYFNLGNFWTEAKADGSAGGLEGCTAKITYGDPYVGFAWAAYEHGANVSNCDVTVMYKGAAHFAENYRFAYGYSKVNGPVGGGNKIDHLFYGGADGMLVGDFMMGTTTLTTEVNGYYEVNADAGVNMQTSAIFDMFKGKSDNYNGQWPHTTETGTIVFWCGKNFGHDFVDDVCTICELKLCRHSAVEYVVTAEPTCVAEGETLERCADCGVVLETIVVPVDSNAHDIHWDFSGATPRAYCHNTGCTKNDYATAAGADYTNIYVSDSGTGFGGFSAKNPLNDWDVAMKFAAMADGDVTIYIIGSITVKSNVSSVFDYYSYLEPKHENMITIRGYGDDRAVFELGGGAGAAGPVYNLSGPLTFENVELSTGRTLASGAGGAAGYMAARHNELIFGDNVSADFNRGNSSMHMGNISIIGGCYRSAAGISCTDVDTNAGATNTVNKLTIKSGTFQDIVGGNTNNGYDDCESRGNTGAIELRFEGEVNAIGFVVFGGFNKNCGDITVTLDGATVSAGRYISFGSENNSASAPQTAGNVKIVIHSGSFEPTESNIGTFSAANAITERKTSLTVCYDPTNVSSKVMYDIIRSNIGAGEVLNTTIITADNFCSETGAGHIGELIEDKCADATCYSEGYLVYKCTVCEKEYHESIGFAEHNFSQTVTIAATCVSPELNKKSCSVCQKAEYTVAGTTLGDHVNNGAGVCVNCNADMTVGCAHTNVTETTTTSGCGSVTTSKCDDCQKVTVISDTTSHNYGPYTVTVEATEATTGVKTRTCKTCGKVDSTIMSATEAVNSQATATGADGSVVDVESSKLTKAERAALNALLQETAYGSEVKVSYAVDGDTVTGITYYIPVPAEYTDMTNVKIVVKDDEGMIHIVDFVIEKGYFVFTF